VFIGGIVMITPQNRSSHAHLPSRTVLAGLLHFKMARETGVAFPGPTRTRISCDLGQGSAGIAFFMHRYLTNGHASFMLDELLLEQPAVESIPASLGVA